MEERAHRGKRTHGPQVLVWSFWPVRGRANALLVATVANPDQSEYSWTKAFKTPNLREKHSPCPQGAQVRERHSPALREPTVS